MRGDAQRHARLAGALDDLDGDALGAQLLRDPVARVPREQRDRDGPRAERVRGARGVEPLAAGDGDDPARAVDLADANLVDLDQAIDRRRCRDEGDHRAAGPVKPASRGSSIAGQRSMTTRSPAARARSAAASSMTPSCIQTALAPISIASSTWAPAADERRKTSTTSTPSPAGIGADRG